MLEGQSQYIISNIDFMKDGEGVKDKSQAASLTKNAIRFNNMPKHDLVLNVGKLITNLVTKADKKLNDNKTISDKEMGYMKHLFDAASSLTAL
jgi:hypothetical protein